MARTGASLASLGPAPATFRASGSRPWFDWLAIVAVVVQAVLSIQFAARASVTHDEYWHLPVGVLHWKTGRFDWEPLNPPLMRMGAAIPVASASQTPPPAQPLPPGEYGNAFVQDHPQSFQSLYFRGRVMMVVASVITSVLLVLWSRSLFGAIGGCLTAIAWCLSPNTIAHGSLVTTDMGAALGFVATLWSLQRFAQAPTGRRALAWGAALGLAQGLKYTCLLLYPLSLVGWFLVDRSGSEPRPARRLIVMRWLAGLTLSLVVLNAAYLGHGTLRRLDSYRFTSQAMTSVQSRFSALGWLPVPLPESFLIGIDQQRKIMEQDHPVYLDNVWQTQGFRSYYLKAILYKTPLGTLALFVLAAWTIFSRRSPSRRAAVYLLAPGAAVMALASFEGMQLGVRYVLPALALASVFIGAAGLRCESPGRGFRLLVLVAAFGALFGLRHHPFHLAYFNEYAGGPIEGRQHLLDSNLDWGQDLDGLKHWMDDNDVDEIGLAYFGTLDPEAVGIKYHLPPSRHPEPGLYAVSVNFVCGRPHALRDGQGGSRPVGLDEFFYFRLFEPIARIGYSIDVYRVTPQDVIRFQNVMRQLR